MKDRQMGSSDLQISEIGIGCMSLGEDNAYNKKLLHRALDGGINFFDTADLYQKGFNETSVGSALKENRKQVIIATKVGNEWTEDGSSWNWNPRKEYILAAIEKSLQRLQTDYIDLYQLHGGTIEDPIDEIIEAFERLQQQGKIRYYGISSIRPNVIREYVKRSKISSVMMQYSLLDRRPEESCLDLLFKHNISVLARGTLAKGLLIDKQPVSFLDYTDVDVRNTSAIIKSIGEKGNGAIATALGYVLNHPAVASAITGIRTLEQVEAIIAASKILLLEKEQIEILTHSIALNYYNEHR
ncbi:MAG: aldo/keto reductase [Chitinophagaceae bacterium]